MLLGALETDCAPCVFHGNTRLRELVPRVSQSVPSVYRTGLSQAHLVYFFYCTLLEGEGDKTLGFSFMI